MTRKIQLKVESLAPLGDGVSINNGLFYYIPGAIPGDVVEVTPEKKNKKNVFTKLVQICTPSPHRREPPCPAYPKCGGCTLQHADESLQIRAKQQSLERQFNLSNVQMENVGPKFGYRRLARLHMKKNRKGEVQLGFYTPGAHHIVDINHCPILDQTISNLLPLLKQGLLRHIEQATLRLALGLEGIFLHLTTPKTPNEQFYQAAHDAVPDLLQGIILNSDGFQTLIAGKDKLTIKTTTGNEILLPVGSFGQANPFVTEKLISTVSSWIQQCAPTSLMELYAGAGNFSFELTPYVPKIALVELDGIACQVAIENFADHQHVKVYNADAFDQYAQNGAAYDTILLDPPRTGAKEVSMKMASGPHNTIIYVSCNPATLKRDIAYLENGSFQLQKIIGFDMFPQTAHVEVAALLGRK